MHLNLDPEMGVAKQPSQLTPGWKAGTTSISESSPVQLDCCGKSTVTSRPLEAAETTTPMAPWETEPHLYLGVATDGFTLTRSPTRTPPLPPPPRQ